MSEETVTIHEEDSSDVAVQEPAEAFDLGSLDTWLAPLRRQIRYCVESSDASFEKIRFIETNAMRFLASAMAESLPDPIRESLGALSERLGGIDALNAADRRVAIMEVHQALVRIDAVLGLPLPSRDRVRIAKSKNNRSLNQKRKELRAAQAAERKRIADESKVQDEQQTDDDALLTISEAPPKKERGRRSHSKIKRLKKIRRKTPVNPMRNRFIFVAIGLALEMWILWIGKRVRWRR